MLLFYAPELYFPKNRVQILKNLEKHYFKVVEYIYLKSEKSLYVESHVATIL